MISWIRRRKWHILIGLALIVILAIISARARGHEVMVAEAFEGPLSLRIAASGVVDVESSDLAFQAGGKIVKLYVHEGDAVSATDLLARLSMSTGVPAMGGSTDVIQAPYDGTVVSIYRREGSVVAPGEPVIRLVSTGKPWVTAFVDSEDASYIRRGTNLQCRAGGYLSEPWDIVVQAVGREAVPRQDLPGSTRQVRLRCDAVSPAFPLSPGTEVDIDGEVPLVGNAVLIPTSAVVREGARDWVWILESDRVHRREVRLGPNNFHLIQIIDGVRPGDQVIVHGKEGLTEGQRVKAELAPPVAAD